jgi:hypothetical protein
MRILVVAGPLLAIAGGIETAAFAGNFDARGVYHPDVKAVAFENFDAPQRYVPDGTSDNCLEPAFMVQADASALSGGSSVKLQVSSGQCQERFLVAVPATKASYRATVWIRHGSAAGRLNVSYPDGSGHSALVSARMAPTGRATSDGWIELASNDFSVDGIPTADGSVAKVYLRINDFSDAEGIDVDALELVPSGEYVEEQACESVRDAVCGPDSICIGGQCARGELSVPPLPQGQMKDDIVDVMEGQLENFFGGQKTRLVDLPLALSTLESIRHAETPWRFWNGWATAVRQLHDWHTHADGSLLQDHGGRGRLNACFIEGDADLSHQIVASDPHYRDILVSHIGPDSRGLSPGDRLVAVDGQHPIAWARGLIDVDWGYHVASDSDSFADFPEALGGPNGLIVRYAKEISVVRCSAGACDGQLETIQIGDLATNSGGTDVVCDNRPTYHLAGPDPTNHYVFGTIFDGPIFDTTPQEAIFGMVWDTLDGGGDPAGPVNAALSSAITGWKANARGVILDHRAGNGGTLDSAELVTTFVRPQTLAAIIRMPMFTAGYTGPDTIAEGLALVAGASPNDQYVVGSANPDTALPVALLLHRDGSASDYMPFGMKGAPKVKIFGPGPTAGAFSTFIQFSYWGGIRYQFASGDTIAASGVSLMGRGVTPDFVVQQKQSDLLAGKDSIHEAALAWVRSELKP